MPDHMPDKKNSSCNWKKLDVHFVLRIIHHVHLSKSNFIFSEESKRRGFTAIVDSRDGSWQNLVTVLGCLKVIRTTVKCIKIYNEPQLTIRIASL